MECVFQSLTSCFGDLRIKSIGGLLTELVPWTSGPTVVVGSKHVNILKQIGEGGYSFVYHVREAATGREYALKKVLIAGPEQMELAKREISVMRSLQHPNLLPLLAHSTETLTDPDVPAKRVMYMLFPLYTHGSLFDEVTKQASRGKQLHPQEVLSIFMQVCRGVQKMHASQPRLAHRDIKPHNVLLQERLDVGPAQIETEDDTEDLAEGGLLQRDGEGLGDFHAVLVDFGSTRPARVQISSRAEAVQLQEDAEAHCSAPYRAPELFDVASHCSVDERVDVWSLGCMLYFMMYAVSPFERVLGEAGGSLALAVQNGRVKWPDRDAFPLGLRDLVESCLTLDPSTRPFIGTLIARAQELLDDL